MKSGLHYILFHKKDLNLKLPYCRGAQKPQLCRCFAIRAASRGDANNLGLFCHQTVVGCLLEVEKVLGAVNRQPLQINQGSYCPKVRISLLLSTRNAHSLMLGGGTVHAPLAVSVGVGGDLSLATFIIHFKATRRSVEWCNLNTAMPCQTLSEEVTELCLKH